MGRRAKKISFYEIFIDIKKELIYGFEGQE